MQASSAFPKADHPLRHVAAMVMAGGLCLGAMLGLMHGAAQAFSAYSSHTRIVAGSFVSDDAAGVYQHPDGGKTPVLSLRGVASQ